MLKKTFVIPILIFLLFLSHNNIAICFESLSVSNSCFIENKGQWESQVKFLSQSGGRDVWITNNGITFDYYKYNNLEALSNPQMKPEECNNLKLQRTGQVIKLNFLGSVKDVKAFGAIKQKAYYNYFIGNNPQKWQSEVQLYSELIIEKIYDRINARIYFDGPSVRYDFILQPGANPYDIKIEMKGQNDFSIDENGDLILKTVFGEIRHNNIFAYQEIDGIKSKVTCNFINEGNIVKFKLGEYDKSKELIIDPLVYSSFLGPTSNSTDQIGMGLISSGNSVLITGTAVSAGFPVTPGAYTSNSPISNNFHVFVSKIIPDRKLPPSQQLVFSSFFGGIDNEFGYDIAIDKDNDIYLTGTTSSQDFPITSITLDKVGGWNETFNRKLVDGFIAKLSGDGKNLLYSTFLGGDRYFYATSIDVDDNKMVYLTGYSNCTFYQSDYRGEGTDFDIVMLKLDPPAGANGLVYFSFYGGNNHDEGYKIKSTPGGFVYLAGKTQSVDFPKTIGTAPKSPIPDAYVLKMDFTKSGNASVVDAFAFGGSNEDIAFDMAVDNSENLIVTGYTLSQDFPITAGAFSNKLLGNKDIFITKIDLSNKSNPIVFSSYLGGKNVDIAYSITSDKQTSVFLTGTTSSPDYPLTSRAYQKDLYGTSDAFVTKINLLSDPPYSIEYSTLLGGAFEETGLSVGYMNDKTVSVAGITKSEDYPVSFRGYNYVGFKDSNSVFLSRLDVINEPLSFALDIDTVICSNNPVTLGIQGNVTGGSGNYSYNWFPVENLDNPTSKNPVILVQSDTVRVMYYFIEVTDNTTGAIAERKIKITVNPSPKPLINEHNDTIVCQDNEVITYTTTPVNGVTSEWQAINGIPTGNPPYSGNSFGVIFNKPGVAKVRLIQTNTNNKCSDFTEMNIHVNPKPTPVINGDVEVCSGCTISYSTPNADSLSFVWEVFNGVIPGTKTNNTVDITWNDVGEGVGKVILIATNKNTGCKDTIVLDTKITAMPKPTILGEVSVCVGDTITYTTPQKADAVNTWNVSGGIPVGPKDGWAFDVYWNVAGAAGVELNQKIQSKNYNQTTTLPVTVHELPAANITGSNTAGISDKTQYSVEFNSNYQYEWLLIPAGIGTLTKSGDKAEVTWLAPGTAKVVAIITSQFDCSSYDTLTVKVNSDIIKVNGTLTVCEGEEYTYTTNSFANATIQWDVTKGTIVTGKDSNTVLVRWTSSGTGTLRATHTFTAAGTKSETSINVTINPMPSKPVITRTGASLEKLRSSSSTDNQWYKGGVIITGATNQEFIPDQDVIAQYTVRVKNQFGCESESDPFTFGPVKTSADLVIRATPKEAADGEKVTIEIIMNNPKDLNDVNAAKSVNIDLKMKAGILIPVDTKFKGTKSGDDRIIKLNIPIPVNASTGQVLESFVCTAVLDNTETTSILPDVISPVNGMITFLNVTNGEFTLSNVCHEGGKSRLMNSTGKIDLMNIIPNPASGSFEVEYETIENGIHRLYLVSSTGKNEYNLMTSELKKGRYKQIFSTDGIPSGAYILILETPYTSKYVKVNISK
jgi:hypothetical protein